MYNVLNDTVNERVYTVNKRVSITDETGVNGKELHSEIMNHTLPRHRRKYNIDLWQVWACPSTTL